MKVALERVARHGELFAPVLEDPRPLAPAARALAEARVATLDCMPTREAVLEALGRVIDPELRRPVTELDMVRRSRSTAATSP